MVIAIPLGCFLDLLVINTNTTRDVEPQAVLWLLENKMEQFIIPPLSVFHEVMHLNAFDFALLEGGINDWH